MLGSEDMALVDETNVTPDPESLLHAVMNSTISYIMECPPSLHPLNSSPSWLNGSDLCSTDPPWSTASPPGKRRHSSQAHHVMSWWQQLVWTLLFALMLVVAIGGNAIVMWIVLELEGGNELISTSSSDESRAIGVHEGEHFIVLEEIPVQNEIVDNICIEQTPASEPVDGHTALASTSKAADELTKSRSPKRKKTDSLLEIKRSFYKKRLECLEAEHKVKMQNLLLDKEIRELDILEKRRKLALENQDN